LKRKVSVLVVILFAMGSNVRSADASCRATQERSIDLRSFAGSSAETFRGPRRIVANYINPLRYDYSWSVVTSYGSNPDLWSKLTSPSGSANTPAAAPAAADKNHATEKANSSANLNTLEAKLPSSLGGRAAPGARRSSNEVSNETLKLAIQTQQLSVATDDLFSSIDTENDKTSVLERGDGGATDVSLSKLREDVFAQQAVAANSTASLKSSGARLKALLQSSDALVQANGNLTVQINQLRDGSWTSSLHATWPLQITLDQLRTRGRYASDGTAALKSEITGFTTAAARDLGTARTNVHDLQNKLLARQVVVGSNKTLSATDSETIRTSIQELLGLEELIRTHETLLGSFAPRIDRLSTIMTELGAILDDIGTNGDKYTSFVDSQQLLQMWNGRLDAALVPAAYSTSHEVTCEYAFARTKQVKVTLVRIDRMPATTATSSTNYEFGTMECASPFDVSAGVAFSSITEREFAIHAVPDTPGGTTTTNRFVTTSHSNFHPLPVALISARICEPNEVFALGGGFGVAANIKGDSSGGSDAEYIVGPTIILYRTVFITPGLHIGRDVRLGDGFSEGSSVPATITTPPLKKSYKPAFGVAITFSKP